ncbi:hypothetical protein [Asticcacaulis sp. AC402]|uniref:hypothetical protein n=1 Tax=Asticcacaulis sp. AC402 TaxID=1282361 RepID=UPI0003C3FB4B|nr:hypothetical protein [Asticcacaulis sp. AC402]ESQ75647.1 hypothetical protein ABAC402_08970 [Asticcacaulis sp. AC402]
MPQYPPLSLLIDADVIPGDITGLENAVDQVLSSVRYRELVVETTPENDGKFYSLVLLTPELGFDVFGSGLRIIFFPADDESSDETDDDSELPVSFDYRWPILKYVSDFETLSFSGSAQGFFDIFLKLADIDEAQFLEGVVACFIDDPQPYAALVNLLKGWQGGASPLAGLTLANPPVGYSEIEYILQQVETISQTAQTDIDIFQAAFETVIEDLNDLDGSIAKLVMLFRGWLGGITRDDIEALLLPQFSLGLNSVKMAIEVPRTVLVPIDANNVPLENPPQNPPQNPPPEPPKSRLTFTAGGIAYDSATGFAIHIAEDVEASLTRSMIPGFGLTLDFDDIKIDLSRTSNIAEADADGRPADFMGVYVGNAVIGLPEKWFHQTPVDTTLGIVGRGLIIGTGGFTGTVRLEALTAGLPDPAATSPPPDGAALTFTLGRQTTSEPRRGFTVGFSYFDMTFQQNILLESNIKGSLIVAGFKTTNSPSGADQVIDIEMHLGKDGEFEVTASKDDGYDFIFPNVFIFKAKKIKVGRDDDRVYIETSGDLDFSINSVLSSFIKAPIAVEGLLFHSDGSMEIRGGDITLPESVVIAIGPARIAITALHFGTHEQVHGNTMRKYWYFGFDAAISMDPGRCGGRGDGIKFYFTVDDHATGQPQHCFMRIEGLEIDMVIPATAAGGDEVLVLKGYLALKDPVYIGSVSFKLLSGKIVGGAKMKYDTSYPAWVVDVQLELPKALPLGSTSLGIYSFRGEFGYRYIASKSKIPTLPSDATWGDYLLAPPRGINEDKFAGPEVAVGTDNPFSVGIGMGLETMADKGKTFSAQLFLLVQNPLLVVLEGRADVLADHHVSIDDDPPFYAYMTLSPESVEMGLGVNYLIPRDNGKVLKLDAVMQAAFFFHNASAWYVHFGTNDSPVKARVLNLFDGYAYLMLSASGMDMGAGVHFNFDKTYGPVSLSAYAYLDTWAHIAFERFQAGGGVALGGHIDVRLFKLGLYIELAAVLTVEVPTPFLIAGSVEICVSVDLVVKKYTKCLTLDFKWEQSTTVLRDPVPVLGKPSDPLPAVGVHMRSGSTYEVVFNNDPNFVLPANTPSIPLDTYIDVKFKKPVAASLVTNIGGYTSPPSGQVERMPPQYGSRVVTHAYALQSVEIHIRNLAGTGWLSYNPYRALAPAAALPDLTQAQIDNMPIGVWQKQDPGYSQIRFLALTPFSWMQDAVGFVPEEMGMTARSTYCVARARENQCLTWTVPQGLLTGFDYQHGNILYRVEGDRVAAVPLSLPGFDPVSLGIAPEGTATFRLISPSVYCKLTITTTAPQVTIRWQRVKAVPGVANLPWIPPVYEDVGAPLVKSRNALIGGPVIYDDPSVPIDRVVLETPAPDTQGQQALIDKIVLRQDDFIRASSAQRPSIAADISTLVGQWMALHNKACAPHGDFGSHLENLVHQLGIVDKQLTAAEAKYTKSCPLPDHSGGETGSKGHTQGFFAGIFKRISSVFSFGKARGMTAAQCAALATDIANLKGTKVNFQAQIDYIRQMAPGDANMFPADWQCGTFVHEVCWLTQSDYAWNQTLPDIDAIAADYTRMRDAISGVIAPIWQPNQTYRITLKTTDAVTDEYNVTTLSAPQVYCVHFRTSGPLGHFDGVAMDTPSSLDAVRDDGRPEVPERAFRFYADGSSSYPDPGGDLLYSKPLYYKAVILRLALSPPYAYHFFTIWTDLGGPACRYNLELVVKDPAQVPPRDPQLPAVAANQAPFQSTPSLGTQSWYDSLPFQTPEITAVNAFRAPVPDAGENATACLTIGGDPIAPRRQSLKVAMGDLKPGKLYTAVVLNRNLQSDLASETGRYPFKTSIYPDFATHIASYKLGEGADSRLAVFAVDHNLANAASEATLLSTARDILALGVSNDTQAYADVFDHLIFGHLQLLPPGPVMSLEFNFLSNTGVSPSTPYGLWIRSPEPLLHAHLPASGCLSLRSGDDDVAIHVLYSRDRCQAFVMTDQGAFPTQNVSVLFAIQAWAGNDFQSETAMCGPFDKP